MEQNGACQVHCWNATFTFSGRVEQVEVQGSGGGNDPPRWAISGSFSATFAVREPLDCPAVFPVPD